MKKVFFILMVFIITGCSTKKLSDTFLSAERYFENYIRYYNSGDFKLAENNFLKAVDIFQKSDDSCNLSRIYIGKYLLENDNSSLEYAKRYSLIGNCDTEINSLNFLLGQQYILDKLPESLKIQATYYKNSEEVIKTLSKSKLPDWTKSRLARDFSMRFINILNLQDADKLIEYGIQIDRFNGWTFNLKNDLLIKKDICKLKNDDCKYIDERLDIIEKKLPKK